MKKILLPCFLLAFSLFYAQDTLYLDKNYRETIPEEAFYFQIESRDPEGKPDLIRKTYWITGQIKSEYSFITKGEEKSLNGTQRNWYETGELYYYENYRKGKRHGDLVAYWKDGSKRRHDVFKKGKLKSGKVWNEEGKEEEHFPFMIPATFPGGQEALATYLKQKCPVPPTQATGTEVRLVFSIRVGEDGYIDKIEIVEGAPHWYNSVAMNAIAEMPQWNPGRFMGDPVGVWFRLPITFRK